LNVLTISRRALDDVGLDRNARLDRRSPAAARGIRRGDAQSSDLGECPPSRERAHPRNGVE
jgi:hypothetical protein